VPFSLQITDVDGRVWYLHDRDTQATVCLVHAMREWHVHPMLPNHRHFDE